MSSRSRRTATVAALAGRNTGLTAAAALSLVLAAGSASHAQSYTVGGDARAFAMGGAGIALSQERGVGGRANPASLAFERNEIVPTFPSLGVRSVGPADANAASSYLIGGMKDSDGISLAEQYGSAKSDLGVSGYASLRINHFEVSAGAVGVAHVIPNAQFAQWVQTNPSDTKNLSLNGRTDIYSAGYYTLPAVAAGFTLPSRKSSAYQLGMGVRVKDMIGVYSHRVVNVQGVPQDNYIVPTPVIGDAPEMGGSSKEQKTGIGADFGFLARPRSGYGLSGAVVVADAVKPNFTFNYTDADGNPAGKVNILQTTVTAGLGYTTHYGTTLAVDLANIGAKATDDAGIYGGFGSTGQELRAGIEQKFAKVITLRGGYSSYAGATYGFGFFGMDIAFGKKQPLEVVKTLNF